MPHQICICTELSDFLETKNLQTASTDCPDCGVHPGEIHHDGCDVERCSVCGLQRISCACVDYDKHDSYFSRWTGFWPGVLECYGLGMITKLGNSYHADLNRFYLSGFYKQFFIKPKAVDRIKESQ